MFLEIKLRGYTGSFSHLERLLAKWRTAIGDKAPALVDPILAPGPATPNTIAALPRAVDPATGWLISPIVAAARCIKPRGLPTLDQAAKVDALKFASLEFAEMRRLAAANIRRSKLPNALRRRASSDPSEASATAMTMPSQKRSTDFTKPS